MEQWKKILWSDESRYVIWPSDRRVWTWGIPGEWYFSEYVSVMVWGYFSWFWLWPLVFVSGNMNSEVYVNILDNSTIFHTVAKIRNLTLFFINTTMPLFIKQWSLHRGLKTIGWMRWTGLQSTDLNPIEGLWNELERRLCARTTLPKAKTETIHHPLGKMETNLTISVSEPSGKLSPRSKGGPTTW